MISTTLNLLLVPPDATTLKLLDIQTISTKTQGLNNNIAPLAQIQQWKQVHPESNIEWTLSADTAHGKGVC